MVRSFGSREPVRIALAGLTVLALALVAALNAGSLPIIGGGTTYTAEFAEAAGLAVDNEVRVAGVKVGTVSQITLERDTVQVSFTVKDAWVGEQTRAAIKIKTLLGQKYVALDPLGQAPLDPTQPIPKPRTLVPYQVLDAFRGLSNTVGQLDTGQLAHSFDQLTHSFAHTPQHVRATLDGLSRLSGTISSRDQQLARLLANTRQVSHTLAERDTTVRTLLADGSTLLSEVSRREQAITHLLDGSQALATQLRGLVRDNTGQLQPVLAQLDQLTTLLQRQQHALAAGITQLAPFVRAGATIAGSGHWVDTYLCGLLLPAVGPLNQPGCNHP